MDINFTGRHTSVPERFRRHAAVKLAKLERLDQRATRVDVEVSKERNPRQSDRSERVELTIRSRGPAIRAEAAADDRYAALDLAFAKLEGRLRRASERRKVRRADIPARSVDAFAAVTGPEGTALGLSFGELAVKLVAVLGDFPEARSLVAARLRALARGVPRPAEEGDEG